MKKFKLLLFLLVLAASFCTTITASEVFMRRQAKPQNSLRSPGASVPLRVSQESNDVEISFQKSGDALILLVNEKTGAIAYTAILNAQSGTSLNIDLSKTKLNGVDDYRIDISFEDDDLFRGYLLKDANK